MPDYRELAKALNSHVLPLIEQVLTKHGAAVLEALHGEVKRYKELEQKAQRYEEALKRISEDCTSRKAVLIAKHALEAGA